MLNCFLVGQLYLQSICAHLYDSIASESFSFGHSVSAYQQYSKTSLTTCKIMRADRAQNLRDEIATHWKRHYPLIAVASG